MIVAALAAAVAAIQPQVVAAVSPEHGLIEGVASDGRTIWLSSLIDRKVLACRARCTTLATLPAGLHPFAIAWDSTRKRLWVAADCPPGVKFITACERGALLALDTRGRIRARIAPPGGAFHPGDVSVANGRVFVSDSQNGAVYRLLPDGRALAALVPPGIGKSAQGSAFDPAGNRLIVADYSQGIASIDLAAGVRTLLPRDNGRPLRGIDGLVRCGATYFAIYNGQAPGLLVSFTIGEGKISAAEPIAGFTMPDPTQIASDGKRLLIVSDSGWEAAGKGEARAKGAPILALPMECGA